MSTKTLGNQARALVHALGDRSQPPLLPRRETVLVRDIEGRAYALDVRIDPASRLVLSYRLRLAITHH